MATDILTCEAHGERTRLTCVECGNPICPKCLVRTEVGLKCGPCSAPAAPVVAGPKRRQPALLVGAGLAVLVVLFVVTRSGGSDPAEPAAQEPIGTWVATPEVVNIRGTAVVLPVGEGQVVATGGGVSAIALPATEVYDVTEGRWTATGDLGQARRGHQGVSLPDGRVLVAGGIAEGELLATAEVYDPATSAWQPTGVMTAARLGHSLTVLRDGRVLAAGGTTPNAQQATGGGQTIRPDSSTEIWDPATGQWTPASPLSSARFEHTATMLEDGRVLVVGGLGARDGGSTVSPLDSAELFDPSAGIFVATGRTAEGRTNHAAVRLPDGSVLVAGGAGGASGDVSLASAERYDPRRGTWSRADAMAEPRSGASATLLSGGRVLVAGGESVDRGVRRTLATAELFDPADGSWRPAARMSCPRSEHWGVAVPGGGALVVGGDATFPGEPPIAQACAELYRPE